MLFKTRKETQRKMIEDLKTMTSLLIPMMTHRNFSPMRKWKGRYVIQMIETQVSRKMLMRRHVKIIWIAKDVLAKRTRRQKLISTIILEKSQKKLEINEPVKEKSPMPSSHGPFQSPNGESGGTVRDSFDLADDTRSNPHLKPTKDLDLGVPLDLNGVSDKMKLLLSRETPIKEKLEKISKEAKAPYSQQSNSNIEKKGECKIPTMERRITRSQSITGRRT
ncbi:hypothetical protein L1887_21830 [Cichorium endivia]|nr:hypothetical protein L1887_21830 [Cichorium endivia]